MVAGAINRAKLMLRVVFKILCFFVDNICGEMEQGYYSNSVCKGELIISVL